MAKYTVLRMTNTSPVAEETCNTNSRSEVVREVCEQFEKGYIVEVFKGENLVAGPFNPDERPLPSFIV